MPDVRETSRTDHLTEVVGHLREQPGGYTEVYVLPAHLGDDGEAWYFTSLNRFGWARESCIDRPDALRRALAYASRFEATHPHHPDA